MPKAYVMGMLTITNPEGMGPYMAAVPETIAEHGGRFLCSSHGRETLPRG
ncbi:MAG: DUF1330 domain-containing protein [Acidimicrobiales bacterium]|nr:DUF1330 domain-containing protein [Acidimicrobiales bacterium]